MNMKVTGVTVVKVVVETISILKVTGLLVTRDSPAYTYETDGRRGVGQVRPRYDIRFFVVTSN